MKKQLREHLEQLQSELAGAAALDEESKKLIDSVLQDVQELLDHTESATSHEPHGLAERLRDATRQFEESHPTLSAAVGRVMDTLTNLGI